MATTLACPARADRKFDADASAKAVAPYLDEQTFAVLHVDLTSVDANALADKVFDLTGADASALPLPRKAAAAALKTLTDAGARDLYVVASLADLPERPPFVVLPLAKDADKLAAILSPPGVAALHSYGSTWQPLHYAVVGGAVVGGEDATLQRLRTLQSDMRPELVPALAAAGGGFVQLAVFPPKDAGKVLETVMPTLPEEVGGGSSRVLTHGFRWTAAGLDAPKLNLTMTVQAADADSAKALLELLRKTYAAAGKSQEVRAALPDYEKLTELLTPKVAADRLTLSLDEPALAIVVRPFLTNALASAERAESTNRLRQLVLALHSYHDAHGRFPAPAAYDKDGKPLLSWRVMILPYLQQEALYKEFHLDEAWDSEHNKPLIARMPAVFQSAAEPALTADGKTTFLAPIGEATMFPGGKGVRLADVVDGTSNTIFIVQADDHRAVAWTKPEDLPYDPRQPENGLFGRYPDGLLTAFADGSAHFIPKTIRKDDLRALFTRNGGEIVTPP